MICPECEQELSLELVKGFYNPMTETDCEEILMCINEDCKLYEEGVEDLE